MSEDQSQAQEAPQYQSQNHPLGIVFGLGEDEYHDDRGLGSSDMKRLAASPGDFYWASKMNPLWKPSVVTPAQLYGRAVHHIILEGRDKFERHYAPKRFSWATKEGKAEKERFAAQGLAALPEDDWERALITGQMIRSNPHLRTAFDDSVGNEVSVFWEANGLKKKCRFDSLKVRAIVDIKNISNDRDISFPKAALRYIDNYHAHVQCEHYREGRLAMRALLAKGAVFGDHNPELLARVVASPEFAFVLVFVQSSGAPLTWACKLSYKQAREWADDEGEVHTDPEEINPMFALGRVQINRAEANYKAYMERFGTDKAWVLNEPVEELDISEMPAWFVRNAEADGV